MKHTTTTVLLASVFCFLPALAADDAQTAPVPAEAPVKWQLDFQYDQPRPIEVILPGDKHKTTFWYMLFRVVNRSGEDQLFAPQFDLYTDTGQLIRAGRETPMAVFDAVKKLHDEPTLVSLTHLISRGKVLQGEDNAVNSVAIWRNFDPSAGGFDVFVGGLSGETAVIKLLKPIKTVQIVDRYDRESGKIVREKHEVIKDTLLVTKQLQLTWRIPGEAAARTRTPAQFLAKRWVMR